MKACVKCGAEIKDGARFCPSCGARQALVCPKCGKELENPDARFCPNCGASLAQAEGNKPEQYSTRKEVLSRTRFRRQRSSG